jgi:PAS domain S-box-containing protein
MISVLCVGRDEPQLILAQEALEGDGDIRSVTATSGRDALSLLSSSGWDAVVADMTLADMDGIALLHLVREKSRVPFILISDTGTDDREDEAIAAGADFCFTKITDTVRQYARVARWIRLAVDNHKKETDLMKNEARYHELIENANLIVLKLDKDSKITFINDFACRYFGLEKNEVIDRPLAGTPFSALSTDPAPEKGYFTRDLSMRSDRYAVRETEHVKKGGERVWISWRNKPLTDKDNVVTGIISFGTDTTERRNAEQALYRANQKLTLLNTITRHDILNQLTVLGGYIEMSRELTTDREMMGYIEHEKKATKAIRNMIKFTKDYQDIGLYRPQWQYLRNIVTLLANTIDFGSVVLKNELGRLEIYADPLFEKVVYTLLENAIRHGGNFTFIRLYFRIEKRSCIVICEDDGVGVPEEDKENIFLREFGKHTGFGLFLSREILGITGFSIRETGVHGKGARFEILIPDGSFREKPG